MIDYYEILSFCAFDVDKAHEIVEGMRRERVEENKSTNRLCPSETSSGIELPTDTGTNVLVRSPGDF